MSALVPVTPRRLARTTWSRIGCRNASVLPEPVPVVTSVGSGRGLSGPTSRLVSLANAAAWCPYGGEPLVPLQRVAPPVLGRPERQPHPQVGALEDPVLPVRQQLEQPGAGVLVGQRERGRQVVQDAPLDARCLCARQQLAHKPPRSASTFSKCAYALAHVGLTVQRHEGQLVGVRVARRVSRGPLLMADPVALPAPNRQHRVRDEPAVGVVDSRCCGRSRRAPGTACDRSCTARRRLTQARARRAHRLDQGLTAV